MILTVTLNPSVDRALEVGALTRGEVLRAGGSHIDPGGKGVNVSRALLANGVRSTAVVPAGGAEGEQLVDLLKAEGVDLLAVPIAGRTRSNITLAEPDGTVTKINEAGPVLSDDEFAEVSDAVLTAAPAADWVVICGSLPPGPSLAAFGDLCARLVGSGARLAVDSSGPALLAGVAAGAALVKPNREELAEAVGRMPATLGDVVEGCRRLRAAGAGAVLASLGADGAVLVDGDGVLAGVSPVSVPRSTVGAGDALLAGFLSTGACDAAALVEGLAWGAAAVSLPGSRMPGPTDLDRTSVRVTPHPDPARRLT
ncbi:1-phosphofructokinase [Actinoplanes campanulatus]|uniref:1-phosphofructokinase n=1 Tax=Actinoplanes campanulatus TaxID=113559 RepID=A0A7W5AQD2_9ACTN|nr:1-phosphofructokinase family hexose kinase [Actinoplanes campanulatus]MBB3100517.1 1-phosphofructokinase [Actinoplanes campanulatus]GGN45350.1 1-phosphofructokinase [Actinoplanes campanulatus]GID41052.1 1-phosphofructokinase [Actinoplanes campanulatus]